MLSEKLRPKLKLYSGVDSESQCIFFLKELLPLLETLAKKNPHQMYPQLLSLQKEVPQIGLFRHLFRLLLSGTSGASLGRERILLQKLDSLHKHLLDSRQAIIETCAEKIKNGEVIIVPSLTPTLLLIFSQAQTFGTSFEIRLVGENDDLAKPPFRPGIRITRFPLSLARLALHHADLMLFDCIEITPATIHVKTPRGLLSELCHARHVPTYCYTDSWKYTPSPQKHDSLSVQHSKGIFTVSATSEEVPPSHITGIISEQGIHKFHHFLEEMTNPPVSSKQTH